MALVLVRYHGLGNDYLVLSSGPTMTPELAREICHRHTGVGSDGVLEPFDPLDANYGVRIWNPDGSVTEKSGNGLRIFARWLVDERAAPRRFTVSTGPEVVICEVDERDVVVDMGKARFDPHDVPIIGNAAMLDSELDVDGTIFVVCAVGVGNPHCVVFGDAPDNWQSIGSKIEVHPRFPNRTNVQFAKVIGAAEVEVRIWERGVGETASSGSSSCAVAAAAVRTGRLAPGEIRLCMSGGTLRVTVSDDFSLQLRGPVERVGRVEVDAAWVARRWRGADKTA